MFLILFSVCGYHEYYILVGKVLPGNSIHYNTQPVL